MTSTLLIKLALFATIIGIAYSLGLNLQCAGQGYATYPCDAGLGCFRRNALYSECLYSCPRGFGWECEVGVATVPVPVNTVPVPTVAAAWDRCGGDGWTGATLCPAGYACYARSILYSQCRLVGDCPAGWTCPGWAPATTAAPVVVVTPTVLPVNTRCNDVGYAVCAAGTGCFRFSATYSECRYYCPTTWACETDVLGANEQCGGEDYVGVTRCAPGLGCYARTKWYAQCAASCPGEGWVCSK